MKGIFEEALKNAEIEKQNKEALKKAKTQYVQDLVKQGVDKKMAKIMADVNFKYGIVKVM